MSEVVIQIIQARNLPKADVIGKIDPYFTFIYGSITYTTQIIKRTYTPVYNESFSFSSAESPSGELLIELYDWDTLTKSDFVGTSRVNISEYKGKKVKKWFPLDNLIDVGESAGEVELEIDYGVEELPEVVVKDRSFPAPVVAVSAPAVAVSAPMVAISTPTGTVALPIIFPGNTDAAGKVIYTGPTKLRNTLPLGPVCSPFSFVLDKELTDGIYRIVLVSQLNVPAWGRWAGVIAKGKLSLRQFHILGHGLDQGTAELSILGVKTNGEWRYKVADYIEPSGTVELVLEFQANAGTLVGSWNGTPLPYGVSDIPNSVHYTFEVPNSLEIDVTAFQKVAAPTLPALPATSYFAWC